MIPVLITVRTSSERLPYKCLLPFGKDTNVIEFIIERCRHYEFEPIICTTKAASDSPLETLAFKSGVRSFRGDYFNVEKRWLDCARHFSLRKFHALDGDDPFFYGYEIRRSMEFAEINKLHHVLPTQSSSEHGLGMMGHSFNLDGNGEQILPEIENPPAVRLTLDYQEDYWAMRALADYLGPHAERTQFETSMMKPLNHINKFCNDHWKANQCRETRSENTTETNSDTLLNS